MGQINQDSDLVVRIGEKSIYCCRVAEIRSAMSVWHLVWVAWHMSVTTCTQGVSHWQHHPKCQCNVIYLPPT